MKKLLYILVVIWPFIQGCEDEVSLDLNDAPPVLVVDAWVNDMSSEQVIKLMMSQPYFDASNPPEVTGAQVSIEDDMGVVFNFSESEPGKYIWDPATSESSFEVGRSYQLTVVYNGDTFEAGSQMNRVPPIDSIVYTYYEERNAFQPEGYYAQFFARDPVGTGDSYWIKTYKNGQYLNRPFDLNIAYDAGFSSGGEIDGLVFIQPIQDAATPLNEDEDAYEPYIPGDSVYVEIHAISNDAFTFLEEVGIQIQRDGGFDEIFAEPLENVPCNINCTTSDTQVVGFFNMASVSAMGKKLEE
ncbi:DUF4249 domain-containing protein [Fulvivirga ligni]|uniref:DUF4249 domain-containing protein n=1 Tax=Fulvivirga ligni TaxID=2904246 RepID=UPI001F165148|nr:DUF4249 domain-containing protein [Fulvivirga ligni]UII20164.1 DUF4249 domain-containing protein [Fulvivirga ligni]